MARRGGYPCRVFGPCPLDGERFIPLNKFGSHVNDRTHRGYKNADDACAVARTSRIADAEFYIDDDADLGRSVRLILAAPTEKVVA